MTTLLFKIITAGSNPSATFICEDTRHASMSELLADIYGIAGNKEEYGSRNAISSARDTWERGYGCKFDRWTDCVWSKIIELPRPCVFIPCTDSRVLE